MGTPRCVPTNTAGETDEGRRPEKRAWSDGSLRSLGSKAGAVMMFATRVVGTLLDLLLDTENPSELLLRIGCRPRTKGRGAKAD